MTAYKFSWKKIKTNLHSLDNKKCILFVGSRAGYKNFQLAAEAFSKLSSEYHFIIVVPRFTIKETRNLQLLVPEDRYTILENVSNHANKVVETKLMDLGWNHSVSVKEGFSRVLQYLQERTKD